MQRTDFAHSLFTPLVAGIALLIAVPSSARPGKPHPTKAYTSELAAGDCTFQDRGRARFFVLEPGHRLHLGGEVKEGWFEVTKTVLADTRVIDGVRTREFPVSADLARARPVLESAPGWGCDIASVRRFQDLPANARAYVRRVEKLIESPIRWVSTGPDRGSLIGPLF